MIRSVTVVPVTDKDGWKRCLKWCFGRGPNLSVHVSQAPAQSYSRAPDHHVTDATLANQRQRKRIRLFRNGRIAVHYDWKIHLDRKVGFVSLNNALVPSISAIFTPYSDREEGTTLDANVQYNIDEYLRFCCSRLQLTPVVREHTQQAI